MIAETKIVQSTRWRTIPDERQMLFMPRSVTYLYKGFIINTWTKFVCLRPAEIPIEYMVVWFKQNGCDFSEFTYHILRDGLITPCIRHYTMINGRDMEEVCELIDLFWNELNG